MTNLYATNNTSLENKLQNLGIFKKKIMFIGTFTVSQSYCDPIVVINIHT